jgi:hypothetical protein
MATGLCLTHSMINASSVYSMSLIPLIPTQSNFYTNERLNLKEKKKKKKKKQQQQIKD